MRKTKLLTILGAVIGVAAIAGACGAADPVDSIEKQGYTLTVKFDISAQDATEENFPTFNGKKDFTVEHRYALGEGQTSTYIFEPGSAAFGDSPPSKPIYTGHFIEGWYADDAFRDRWDFENDRATESLTLRARWYEDFVFEIKYYENGAEGVADTLSVPQGGRLDEYTKPKRDGYTLLGLWQDRACTIPWDYQTAHTGTLSGGVQTDRRNTVWSTWLEGDYKLVYTVDDLKSVSEGQNYMLMADLDYTDKGNLWNASFVDYHGEFNGNGHTIRNLTFQADYGKKVSQMGMFGSLCGVKDDKGVMRYAKIVDLTLENVTMKMSYNGDYRATMGLLAGAVDAGVAFENVRIEGAIDATEMISIPSRNFYLGKIAGLLNVGTDGEVEGLAYRIDVLTDPAKFNVSELNANDFELVKVK